MIPVSHQEHSYHWLFCTTDRPTAKPENGHDNQYPILGSHAINVGVATRGLSSVDHVTTSGLSLIGPPAIGGPYLPQASSNAVLSL